MAQAAPARAQCQGHHRRVSAAVPRTGGIRLVAVDEREYDGLADLHPSERELIAREQAAREAGTPMTLDQLGAEHASIVAERHERLERDAHASWRSMEGWANVTTEEEWRTVVHQADD